jgi:hypothetical protein
MAISAFFDESGKFQDHDVISFEELISPPQSHEPIRSIESVFCDSATLAKLADDLRKDEEVRFSKNKVKTLSGQCGQEADVDRGLQPEDRRCTRRKTRTVSRGRPAHLVKPEEVFQQ